VEVGGAIANIRDPKKGINHVVFYLLLFHYVRLSQLGIEEHLREQRLRWFGHMERMGCARPHSQWQ